MGMLNKREGILEYDNLFAGVEPSAEVMSVTIKAVSSDTELKRGTVLARNTDGTMSLMDTGLKANCVLADDVKVGTVDTEALAYRTGHFVSDSLIVADTYSLNSDDKENLREVGILLSDAF